MPTRSKPFVHPLCLQEYLGEGENISFEKYSFQRSESGFKRMAKGQTDNKGWEKSEQTFRLLVQAS